jgi:hypothetical protein
MEAGKHMQADNGPMMDSIKPSSRSQDEMTTPPPHTIMKIVHLSVSPCSCDFINSFILPYKDNEK